MLVKKVNQDWKPSENPELEVGETIEITNPKRLVLDGHVVGVDKTTGADLTAFDLYGVIIQDEVEEFRKYQDMKKQEFLSEKLEAENAVLIKEAAEKKAKADLKKEDDKDAVVVDVVKADDKGQDIESMPWKDMTAKGTKLGIYKVGMSKVDLIAALKNV